MEGALLVHGLRDPALHNVEDWRELLTDIVQSKWPARTPSQNTASAEAALGIRGQPYYFYVMRTQDAFGFVVFLFEDVGRFDPRPSDSQMGASPFDSGGLWAGLLHPLNGSGNLSETEELAERKRLFSDTEVSIGAWHSAFLAYFESNYTDKVDYIKGLPPRHGTPPISNITSLNKARAWTWEVRFPRSILQDRLQLRCVCMRPDDFQDYKSWLADNLESLGVENAKTIIDRISTDVVISDNPCDTIESRLRNMADET